MVLLKFNSHVVIFFSLVLFLLLRQSISEDENAPIELLRDSNDSPSQKIDLSGQKSNEEEKDKYDSSTYLKKTTNNKESEKGEKEKRKKEHKKERMKDKEEEEEEKEKYDSSTYLKKMTKKESDKDEKEEKKEHEKENMKDKKEEEDGKEKMREKKVKIKEDDEEKMKDKKEEEEEEEEKEKIKDKEEKEKEKEKNDEDNEDKKKMKKKEKEEEDEEEGDKDKKKKTKESGDEKDNKSFSSTSMSSSSTSFNSVESILYLTNAQKKNPTIPSKIKQGCKKADFPNECESTLISLGKDMEKLDPSSIFKTSAQALTQALNVAKASVLDPNMGVTEKEASICDEVYQDAVEALKDGMKATTKNDRYMASLKLSTVVTDVDTCQGVVGHGSKSKLATLNVVLSKLAANTISLGDVAGYV